MIESWFIRSLAGGFLLGIAALLLLYANGRMLGISGIAFDIVERKKNDPFWRLLFLLGLIAGAVSYSMISGNVPTHSYADWYHIIAGGLLVGFGTSMANGCTSGHGICGVGRLSRRSIVATLTFLLSGILTIRAMIWWGGIQ